MKNYKSNFFRVFIIGNDKFNYDCERKKYKCINVKLRQPFFYLIEQKYIEKKSFNNTK